MKSEEKKTYACPSCYYRYRVPETFEGRTVTCKKCGSRFRLSSDPTADPPQEKAHVQDRPEEISADDSFLIFGKLALKFQLITEQQLQEALAFQKQKKENGQDILLGEVMVMTEMISQNELDYLLSAQEMPERRKLDLQFGAIASKNGFASQKEIVDTLKEQKRIFLETKSVVPIGHMLLDQGIITRDERDAVLARLNRLNDSIDKEGGKKEITECATGMPFDLVISEDRLAAHISAQDKAMKGVSLKDIKELLKKEKVKYGVVDDALILEYLKKQPGGNDPCKIAEGRAPEPGRDGKIKYYFDTNPLKTGTIEQGGIIDFKNRGEIPQVKSADIIAEKIPGILGTPGMDVFGDTISPPKVKGINLQCGHGVVKSKDGLKISAGIDGRPQVSASGKVVVLPELKISGDVGLETGHIDFNGDIEVSGSVRDGFRIKGGRLMAREILKAEIDITGDIIVIEGVTGARIKAGGSVRARFINASDVEAFGDVMADNELLDSKIESSGACFVKGGKVASSWLSANKGIEAKVIGSDVSKPCTLVVGINERAANQINMIRDRIQLKKDERETNRELIDALQEESKEIEKEIGKLAQVQDRATTKQRALNKESAQNKEDGTQPAEIEKLICDLQIEASEAEKAMEKLFNGQEQLTEKASACEEIIKNLEEEIKDFRDEIEALTAWSQREKGVPVVTVHDTIFSDTKIRGPHSSVRVKEEMKQVSIRETMTRDPDSTVNWKMSVSRLKDSP